MARRGYAEHSVTFSSGCRSEILKTFLLVGTLVCHVHSVTGTSGYLQQTLALIKPDAVHFGYASDIKRDIRSEGFKIVAEREMWFPSAFAERFYAEHSGRHFYADLVEFMSSGPALALVLEREDAVATWRALMGPTDSADARTSFPNSIRARYGTDGRRNAVHGSDSAERAAEEIRMVFDESSDRPFTGQMTHLLVGTSALAAAVYGLRTIVLSWPLWIRMGESSLHRYSAGKIAQPNALF